MTQNSIYHAALGDLYQQTKKFNDAKFEYEQAIALTKSKSEIELLQTKINELA